MDYDNNQSFLSKINCPINNSKSKISYSFGKDPRFKTSVQETTGSQFYYISDQKSKKFGVFSRAKRFKIMQRSISGELVNYPSSFDPNQHNAPKFSFGLLPHSRYRAMNTTLGPGPCYDTRSNLGKNEIRGDLGGVPKYSFGKCLRRSISQTEITPGPAEYNTQSKMLGSYVLSKHKNAARVFLGTHSERFEFRKTLGPGPSGYYLPSLIGKQRVFDSKIKSSPGISFSGKKMYYDKIDDGPGPGAYDRFSEFEGFENKIKRLKKLYNKHNKSNSVNYSHKNSRRKEDIFY